MAYKLTDILAFGKHRGRSIKEIAFDDPTYIEWALDETDDFELDDEAMEVYESAIDEYYWIEENHYPSPHYSDW